MKSLILVTPREFKCHFGEVIDMCTDMCMTTNHEIVITIPEKKNGETHVEIAKITPVGSGVKYSYNYELLKKYGIKTDNRMNKIESVIVDALEKEGVYRLISPEVENRIARAIEIAAREFAKQFGL